MSYVVALYHDISINPAFRIQTRFQGTCHLLNWVLSSSIYSSVLAYFTMWHDYCIYLFKRVLFTLSSRDTIMSTGDVRRGITQASFNQEQANTFYKEVLILSIIAGVFLQSWFVFLGGFDILICGNSCSGSWNSHHLGSFTCMGSRRLCIWLNLQR